LFPPEERLNFRVSKAEDKMDWQPYTGVIGVSVATVALYYVFLLRLTFVRARLHREHTARGEKFDRYQSADRTLRAADRAQLNMLEHMPTFFVALWINAWVVSADGAAMAGIVWVLARAAYPLLVGREMGRDFPLRVLWSTFTGYGAIAYLAGSVIWTLLG
jgi:uncharacterized MAPEG superfamily protein